MLRSSSYEAKKSEVQFTFSHAIKGDKKQKLKLTISNAELNGTKSQFWFWTLTYVVNFFLSKIVHLNCGIYI